MVEKKIIRFGTVKALVKKYGDGIRIATDATEQLREWAEGFIAEVIKDAAGYAKHVKRKTIFKDDIKLVTGKIMIFKGESTSTTVATTGTDTRSGSTADMGGARTDEVHE